MLEEPFSWEEIKDIVWDSEGDRSPGPKGFNIDFIKKCWEIVGDEVA